MPLYIDWQSWLWKNITLNNICLSFLGFTGSYILLPCYYYWVFLFVCSKWFVCGEEGTRGLNPRLWAPSLSVVLSSCLLVGSAVRKSILNTCFTIDRIARFPDLFHCLYLKNKQASKITTATKTYAFVLKNVKSESGWFPRTINMEILFSAKGAFVLRSTLSDHHFSRWFLLLSLYSLCHTFILPKLPFGESLSYLLLNILNHFKQKKSDGTKSNHLEMSGS